MMDSLKKKQAVKDYYGKELKSSRDLKTSACCTTNTFSNSHKEGIKLIAPEIKDKFYGCGSPLPPLLENCHVLDLGCGTGRDVYLASYLSGPNGFVTGVDMTEEQLEVAQKHLDSQMRIFNYDKANVEFKEGYIEDLKAINIEDNKYDIVISNCVINLSIYKRKVFSEIFRVLKPGGELYFADVFADKRIPEKLVKDPVLYGECLSGALYIEDFRRILQSLNCLDYRIVSKNKITIQNDEVLAKTGNIAFYSITVRVFKIDSLEDRHEDYGQAAYYLGSIPNHPDKFVLDNQYIFETNKSVPICGNTADILSKTRFQRHFKIAGNKDEHFGPFEHQNNSCDKQNFSFIQGSCC